MSETLWMAGVVLALSAALSAAAGAADASPALPRIAAGDGLFVERRGGRPFTPVGFNYIRLRPKWHGTFAPSVYDPRRAEAMLAEMQAGGFNTVRVFIDPAAKQGIVQARGAEGLSKPYLGRLVDFLSRARAHRVYVIPSLLALPCCKRYDDLVGRPRRHFGHANEMYFDDRFVRAKALYVADVLAAIQRADPDLLSTVLACELDNETHFFAHGEPFSRKEGTYKWQGRSYDLADDEALQRLADAAVIRWADACVDAARRVDPHAMVSVNVFTFAAVGRSGPAALRRDKTQDRRFPARPVALTKTKLAYLDVHFYPFGAETLDRDVRSIEMDALRRACKARRKPLIMGEFGAFKKSYPTVRGAAGAMRRHLRRVRSLGFAGWLYWTYDTDEQPFLWNARSEGGEIYQALQAEARPPKGP